MDSSSRVDAVIETLKELNDFINSDPAEEENTSFIDGVDVAVLDAPDDPPVLNEPPAPPSPITR